MRLIEQCPKCKRVLRPPDGLLKAKCPKCDEAPAQFVSEADYHRHFPKFRPGQVMPRGNDVAG